MAGMRTLEILASRSDPVGKSMIQESFATTTGARDEPTYPHSPSSPRSYEMTDNGAGDDHQGSESLIRRAQGKDVDQEAKRDEKMLAESKGVQQGLHHQNGNHDNDSRCFERDPTFPAAGDNASPDKVASDGRLVHRGTSGGAASFALQVADAWSRDDSRTIVRRAGAALTAASALSLLWAVLMDAELGGDKNQKGDDVVTPSLSVSSAVDEFVEGQVSQGSRRGQPFRGVNGMKDACDTPCNPIGSEEIISMRFKLNFVVENNGISVYRERAS